jgi:hypothetical protein
LKIFFFGFGEVVLGATVPFWIVVLAADGGCAETVGTPPNGVAGLITWFVGIGETGLLVIGEAPVLADTTCFGAVANCVGN